MDKLLLKILLGFVKFFFSDEKDFAQLKIITQTKVMMDRRRVAIGMGRKVQKENANPLLVTLIVYSILGLFMALLIGGFSILSSMIIFHGYLLFMMAMTLITDFSSVLLDTADNNIILPKPVKGRTVFIARVVHILVYLLQFTIALALFPLIAAFIKFGLVVGLAMLMTITLTVGLAVFLSYFLYALILRFADEQKIKDIVGYFQIFITILFGVGSQLLPRLVNFEKLNLSFSLHWYSYLIPPVWMAAVLESVHLMHFNRSGYAMLALALLVPIFAVWLMVTYLAPGFSKKLALLGNNSGKVVNKD
ncbi:MAG: hypothetical protein ABIO05_03105, partial [Ferruginibacter sp.]